MHHQCIGGREGSELLVDSICLNSPKAADKLEKFNMGGGRGRVRVIRFLGPFDRPCVPEQRQL
jgi:hypothetical protein